MIQSIWAPVITKSWSDSIVSVKDLGGIGISCGTIVYEFSNSDSTPVSSTRGITFNLSAKTFSMKTDLPANIGSLPLKIKVSLSSYPTATVGIKDFKVNFITSCEPPYYIGLYG